MGPRKWSKPNPKAEGESVQEGPSLYQGTKLQREDSLKSSLGESVASSKLEAVEPPHLASNGAKTVSAEDGQLVFDDTNIFKPQSSKNWYSGTWPRGNKADPVTEVAKESISAAGGAASEALASARARTSELPTTPLKSPTIYLSKSVGNSSRSLPLAATTTKVHITSNAESPMNGAAEIGKTLKGERNSSRERKTQTRFASVPEAAKSDDAAPTNTPKSSDVRAVTRNQASHLPKATDESASWLSWFSKSKVITDGEPSNADGKAMDVIRSDPQSTISETPGFTSTSPERRRKSEPNLITPNAQQDEAPRSWLSLWGNASTQTKSSSSAGALALASNSSIESNAPESQRGKILDAAGSGSVSNLELSKQPADSTKSLYGWAFRSGDQRKNDNDKKCSKKELGELALAGSPSPLKVENAQLDEARGLRSKAGKRESPQALEAPDGVKKPQDIGDNDQKDRKLESISLAQKVDAGPRDKRAPDNLLLPHFESTYSTVKTPSLIQQVSRLLQIGSFSEPTHVNIVKNPLRVKKALAIGVHGYFPAPLIRSVLGQPTGTSIRFANGAASAIQRWTQHQGYSCEIEKVALEGEGKIAERIELLWKLMLNWIDNIRKADFVMIACHSQGVPVAMMLVAKLIAFGCLGSAKIGVCAMAGVNLGPFADYKSRWISGSAGELFEFALPDSQVSKDYQVALDAALRYGVKTVYVGSIDDQLVSLDSSTFGSVSHPHIYRAVFVDGRVHAPDFLTHLVGFALKLRNLGISDHGVIRELSSPLAGSLYGGEGHSRIYEDEAGYDLAVQYALETTSLGEVSPQFHRERPKASTNPYILPFAVRGVLEEDYVRTELYGEVTELIKLFDEWRPSTKALKDVKFRLEGVRSRL